MGLAGSLKRPPGGRSGLERLVYSATGVAGKATSLLARHPHLRRPDQNDYQTESDLPKLREYIALKMKRLAGTTIPLQTHKDEDITQTHNYEYKQRLYPHGYQWCQFPSHLRPLRSKAETEVKEGRKEKKRQRRPREGTR